MITNGNYEIPYIGLKDYIEQAFIQFYGENNADVVKEKLGRTTVYEFDERDYLEKYYDNYILKYRDIILNKFWNKLGIKRIPALDNVIWGETPISEANINIACLGGSDITLASFSEETKKKIRKCRKDILDIFDEKISEEIGNIGSVLKVKELRKTFLESVKEIEMSRPCDVFHDINKLDKNLKIYLVKYLQDINNKYYSLSDCDNAIINVPNFIDIDTDNLEVDGLLFDEDLSFGGIIDSFGISECEMLADPKEDETVQLLIVCDRLKYLTRLSNTKFQYFEKEEILRLNDILLNIKDDKKFDEIADKICKEYVYQKNNPQINPALKIDENTQIESWKQGEFIPSEISENIKDIRKFYLELSQNNLRYFKTIAQKRAEYEQLSNSFFTAVNDRQYKNDNIFKPINNVYIRGKNSCCARGYINYLIHELNHSMAVKDPYELNKNDFKCATGISKYCIEHNNTKIGDEISETNTENLEEYINERQAKEIHKLLIPILEKNNYEWPGDDVIKPTSFDSGSLYDYYYFLFEDFYKLFKDELRDINVDDSFDFTFDYYLPKTPKGEIYSNLYRMINKKFNAKNFYNSGFADMHYLEELNNLVDIFNNDIMPEIEANHIGHKAFRDPRNWLKLDKKTQMKIYALIKEKNKIMSKLQKDLIKKKELADKHPEMEENEHFVSLANFIDTKKDKMTDQEEIEDIISGWNLDEFLK